MAFRFEIATKNNSYRLIMILASKKNTLLFRSFYFVFEKQKLLNFKEFMV